MVMSNSSKVQGKGINGKINQGSSEDEIAMKERRKTVQDMVVKNKALMALSHLKR